MTPSPYFADPHITMSETPLGKAVPEPPSPEEHERRQVRNERGCGQALAGRLLRACLDRGIEPRDVVRRAGADARGRRRRRRRRRHARTGRSRCAATKGVVLASGGFEWNADLRRAFLRGPMTHPVSMETSTGDGLLMAMKAGAMLSNMREAWWIPVGDVPVEDNPLGRILVNGQRTLPHSIMVNRRGRRFTNEAANYNAFGAAFHVEDVSRFEYANLPCWLMFDQQLRRHVRLPGHRRRGRRRGAGVGAAGRDARPSWPPSSASTARSSSGRSTRWNAARRRGPRSRLRSRRQRVRLLVGRSRTARAGATPRSGRWSADRSTPTRSTAARSAPRAARGSIPTPAVLDLDGDPIAGLYAAGNVMGSPFGMTYGGPGGTIGPAMVFGYLAGRHAAGR